MRTIKPMDFKSSSLTSPVLQTPAVFRSSTPGTEVSGYPFFKLPVGAYPFRVRTGYLHFVRVSSFSGGVGAVQIYYEPPAP